jgi:uncharacterized protein YneF (UPF0154 family)
MDKERIGEHWIALTIVVFFTAGYLIGLYIKGELI